MSSDVNRFAPLASIADDDDKRQLYESQRQRSSSPGEAAAEAASSQPAQRSRSAVIYGKSSATLTISAAQRMRKKAVFCVGSVGIACTPDRMKTFEAKPRHRRYKIMTQSTGRHSESASMMTIVSVF